MSKTKLVLPTNLLSIPPRKFKLDRRSEYYTEDRALMKQYQMLNFKELYERFERIIIIGTELVIGEILSDVRYLVSEEYESELFMGKNSVVIKMIREMVPQLVDKEERENLKQLEKLLVGQVTLLFTNRDPLEMIKVVESKSCSRVCAVGELVREDVNMYEGDTGLEPHKTQYFQACNIPTRIQRGQIQIMRTVLFLKKGTRVTPSDVALIRIMNMRPFKNSCIAKYVFERKDHCVYKTDLLRHDLNPSVYEAMNDLGSLSLECNLLNQLTIIAELKKSIQNIMIVENYVEEESENNLFELD